MNTIFKIKVAGFLVILFGGVYFLTQFFAPKPIANNSQISTSSQIFSSDNLVTSSSSTSKSFTISSSNSSSKAFSSKISQSSTNSSPISSLISSSSNSSKISTTKSSQSSANVQETRLTGQITGNTEVDLYIQNLAEARGYQIRQEAKSKSLSPEMKTAIAKLQANAKKDGLNFVLVSGFRSVSDQRALFLKDYNTKKFSQEEVLGGKADRHIDSILSTRSIPGYSKHHTGNTADFGCNNSDLLGFKNTKCFEWIRKNNYANAKIVGLEPSYPPTGQKMGPNPEEWEYVLQ